MSATARVLRLAPLTLIVALLAGCAGLDLRQYRTVLVTPVPDRAGWRGLPVATGQVIVNEIPDAMSLFGSLSTERFAPFTHAGIIVVEPKGVFVYEAFGFYLPLPWTRPNQQMGGGVRRVSLESFIARGGMVAIHEPPASADRAGIAAFARDSVRRHVPFDGDFDPRDGARFYCVEFVARALEAAGAPRIAAARVTSNRSVRVALDWLGVKGSELELAGDLVAQSPRVVLLSPSFSAEQVDAYFALKQELHRRFTADQKIGSLVSWRGQRLGFRPRIDAYFTEGTRTLADPRLLADRMFGPRPDARFADAAR